MLESLSIYAVSRGSPLKYLVGYQLFFEYHKQICPSLLFENKPEEGKSTTANYCHRSNSNTRNCTCAESFIGFFRIIGSRGIVGIGLTTLALTFNEVVFVRRRIVWIGFSALALTFNEVVFMRRYVVGIGFSTFTLAFNEVVFVRRYIVRIGCTTRALAVNVVVRYKVALFLVTYRALCFCGTGCFAVLVLSKFAVLCVTYRTLCLCFACCGAATMSC